ncbi:lauroyl acyltransferase [Thioclava sp. SK-1]|nr:lauroyl acyltransferase [Thioclava sp. SK-1]
MTDRVSANVFKAGMSVLRRLPYPRRIHLAGRMVARLAPALGMHRRIRANLALTCPDLNAAQIDQICESVPDNIGRSLAEIYSGDEFISHVQGLQLSGPGADHLIALRDAGKSAVLVTGHFGNYDAWRGALHAQGFKIGALYRPMNNRLFNRDYLKAISRIAEPLFPRDRRGMAGMVRHLKDGGMIGLASDQYFHSGAQLTFFGQTAPSPLSAAELAIKYDVDMIPIYAIRKDDGLSFTIIVERPIPVTSAEEMTQAYNDSLESQVRAHMGQWFWIHRRWKNR